MSTATPEPAVIRDDPRVQELARCVAFAIGSFKNQPVIDPATNKMETWHGWFKRAITDAGFVITEPTEAKLGATEPVPPTDPYRWGKPPASRTFHIFHGTRSMCGSWMFGGADEPVTAGNVTRGKGDCSKCVNRFNAHHKTGK